MSTKKIRTTEIYAHEHPMDTNKASIFLAGPSPRKSGDYNWRIKAVEYVAEKKFSGLVYIPLPRDGNWLKDYDAQIDWELKYLTETKIIAFWIPRNLKQLPGFTTNIEFGLFLRSGKIILGYPPSAPKMRYLHYLANINNVPVYNTLEKTLDKALELAMLR